eukprot:CAMPEP_0184513772 /NCGR_PEP_ID=MMETSP0198_2-20121128/3602_1 /TAXON_ID=1112570 /ORGANISM="Thraustochytrium sp., Strain LLF1b" /LENGTH=83 /DNA_ID=CAMNT_0026903905 /DNA_START=1498 /DNA_END=1745 /DNA_ORIENTATION=+
MENMGVAALVTLFIAAMLFPLLCIFYGLEDTAQYYKTSTWIVLLGNLMVAFVFTVEVVMKVKRTEASICSVVLSPSTLGAAVP